MQAAFFMAREERRPAFRARCRARRRLGQKIVCSP